MAAKPHRFACLLLLLLLDFLCPVAVFAAVASGEHSGPASRSIAGQAFSNLPKPADVVIVAGHEPWLVAVACPLLSRQCREAQLPLLLVAERAESNEAKLLLGLVAARHCLVLRPDSGSELSTDAVEGVTVEELVTGHSPLRASLLLARRFWGHSRLVVVAALADPEAVILGSALAAQVSAPLLVHDEREDAALPGLAASELEAKEVLVVGAEQGQPPRWAFGPEQRVSMLDRQDIQTRIIATLTPAKVRTIVLARVPLADHGPGRTAWLAPYLSLARRAPVVLTQGQDAADAADAVTRFVRAHRLCPGTVTILADYDSIGKTTVRFHAPMATAAQESGDELTENQASTDYEVGVEPCMPAGELELATVGVGRLPFASLVEASTFFARGLARERLLRNRAPRLLMVANPAQDNLHLPLCETVSRCTASEFKNARVPVDALYGQPADSPEVWAAAGNAQLIIYEGHLSHQRLFDESFELSTTDASYGGEDSEFFTGGPRLPQTFESGDPVAQSPDAYDGPTAWSASPYRPSPQLDGLPVVVLQSCESLKQGLFRRICTQGGVALVGSTTRIHSASGSALVKAISDGLLYRNATLGEAMREAQNYFCCLRDLKSQRGHAQQAKSRRVAMSFQLWGDPELRVFPQPLQEPRIEPIGATWRGLDRLEISVPTRRLQTVTTAEYSARMYPGSQTAGLVRRRKSTPVRRVTPVYFFRLPLPQGFLACQFTTLSGPENEPNRAVFRVDPTGRSLYVLYYPGREKLQSKAALQFAN